MLDERYVIRSRIARGGMAMVYLANDLRLERRVAVKVMHEHLAEDENFTRRFEQEARSAARLSHPNLVNVFDQGHDLGRTYLVMEYLPSITLRELLKQQKRLTAEQAMEIGEAVLSGLAAAHHAGIVHRDLKPENVLLADDGRIKLGDFGLARAVSANTTTGQALLGTIAYLSPELVTRGVADARSDLYAFGIMMYEMLAGTQPFTGEQPMQIAYQHAHSEVPAPSLKSTEATPELDELVRWTTQRDPEDRPRDAGEALQFLRDLGSGLAAAGSTRVLPRDMAGGSPTSSTTVLDGTEQQALASSLAEGGDADAAPQPDPTPASPLDRAAAAARKRGRKGRLTAVLLVLLIALAGGTGWWFGQGPGSRVTVPDVAGQEMAAAQASLEDRSLLVEVAECPSLEVPVGLAVSTDPESGSRLDRGSTVRLCQSSGPRQLPVPTIVGLSQQEAESEIRSEGFTFGEVLERRFADSESGTVLAALGQDGEPLGDTYAEQGRIDLVVSAGAVPDVAGLTVEEATRALESSDLRVDAALGTEEHNADVPEGQVIGLLLSTDPVRPGDAVGLNVSLGPELFEVPDVANMTLREASNTLQGAGFATRTNPLFSGALLDAVIATSTDPAAGTKVPAGTEIYISGSLFG
ncbi:Stk1 family PASTA domain-containing Ser/Thr kinase [Leucobacter tenebrionis]|uniref:Stk1 family PASTA domain-containing Ser/Thr kinase n=1 Tax=Leucobacter tenebrionis TaxID=2873270 RepID=UPI001CA7AD7C|nr:Stk1 family PASTA domain-containing Ser/Thr kinase [Leucobacter tenebrionis]